MGAPPAARPRPFVCGTRTFVALAALALVACATPLSPSQRQQLETKIFRASYEETFAATRDAFFNSGYMIRESDFDGGVLSASQEVLAKDPKKVLAAAILVPPAADFYMGRYLWGIVDLLLWPWSIAWAAPSNDLMAANDWKEVHGTVSLERLKPDITRVRIALSGMTLDTEKYPAIVHRLQDEIERQLFMKESATIGGEPF